MNNRNYRDLDNDLESFDQQVRQDPVNNSFERRGRNQRQKPQTQNNVNNVGMNQNNSN